MENRFKVIDGIKYDLNQSIAICSGHNKYKRETMQAYKSNWLRKSILSSTTNTIITKDYSVRKGINNHYFLDILEWHQTEKIDEINHKQELQDDFKLVYWDFRPIKIDEAIEIYFNGYHLGWNNWIEMNPLISEQEAFGEIPIA